MPTWHSHGLRGSAFEDMINKTNEAYAEGKLALIQKIPTPITPIKIDDASRHITLAYFEKKSTVDYIGAIQGIPVCFDAKESHTDTFPLQNIHKHQLEFMQSYEAQEGLAFILIYFTERDNFYYIGITELAAFWQRAEEVGRKSFRYDELDESFFFEMQPGIMVPYLDMIQKDLNLRKST